MNADKLAKLQASVRIGGKGTPRRKTKKVHHGAVNDDKKLQASFRKLGVQPLPIIEECNMFRDDGKIMHFKNARVQASLASNLFIVSGQHEVKEFAELLPGIIPQMGAESLSTLRKLAEKFKSAAGAEDDGIPDLVEGSTFEKEAEIDE